MMRRDLTGRLLALEQENAWLKRQIFDRYDANGVNGATYTYDFKGSRASCMEY